MADQKLTLRMSEGGRSNRDQHSLTFRVRPTGAFTALAARNLAVTLAMVLSDVMFTRTHFLRALYTPIDNYGHSTGDASTVVPLSQVGARQFGDGDGSSRDEVVLAILKTAEHIPSGTSLLRHVLSANEEAAYVLNGTIPDRFGSLSADSGYGDQALGPAMLAAFEDSGFQCMLPPHKNGLLWTARPVLKMEAQDFRLVQVTKRKPSLEQAQASAAQRKLNEFARNAKRIWDAAVEMGTTVAVVATIAAIAGEALALYEALPLLVRALVRYPVFPALPAPTS